MRLLRGLAEVHGHRGGNLGKVGRALLQALDKVFGLEGTENQEDHTNTPPMEVDSVAADVISPNRLYRVVERARVRDAPHRMASTTGFREVGEVLSGDLVDGWVQLADGGFVLMCWSDGEALLVPFGDRGGG